MNQKIPPTINLHTIRACNYSCKYCFAGFQDRAIGLMPQAELHEILRQFAATTNHKQKISKVNFAGGEPLASPNVVEDIAYAKSLELTTSIVTNGSLLTDQIIEQLGGHLDLLTISIDSLKVDSNLKIGRATRHKALSEEDYLHRIKTAQAHGIAVKVNTVVNRVNVDEDMMGFIREARPIRWKLFKVLKIENENGGCFSQWAISDVEFMNFVERHRKVETSGVTVVPEANEQMYGTYGIISPDGRFVDNSQGHHRYSRRIVDVGIEEAFAEINFSMDGFEQRGGVYSI